MNAALSSDGLRGTLSELLDSVVALQNATLGAIEDALTVGLPLAVTNELDDTMSYLANAEASIRLAFEAMNAAQP